MLAITVPMEFYSQLSLMQITAMDKMRNKESPSIHFKRSRGELKGLGMYINRNPNAIPIEFTYFKVNVLSNNKNGLAFVLSTKWGGNELLINQDNKHLVTKWFTTAYKPTNMTEWRRYYGNNWRQPIRPVHRVL